MQGWIAHGLRAAVIAQLTAAAALSIAMAEASGAATGAFTAQDFWPALLLAGGAVTSLVRARLIRR